MISVRSLESSLWLFPQTHTIDEKSKAYWSRNVCLTHTCFHSIDKISSCLSQRNAFLGRPLFSSVNNWLRNAFFPQHSANVCQGSVVSLSNCLLLPPGCLPSGTDIAVRNETLNVQSRMRLTAFARHAVTACLDNWLWICRLSRWTTECGTVVYQARRWRRGGGGRGWVRGAPRPSENLSTAFLPR